MISIRDAALSYKATKVVESIHDYIFHDKAAAYKWIQETVETLKSGKAQWNQIHQEGVELPFSKVIPSFVDRKPYFEMLTQGPIKQEVDIEVSSAVLDSHQGYAKSLFDSYIADMLKGLDEKNAE